jgi:hypothetical protein
MVRKSPRSVRSFGVAFVLMLLELSANPHPTSAARLTLQWTDTSTNEEGFSIERKTGSTGSFANITTVGANIAFFVDTSLEEGLTYCYRVQAYNAVGVSSYSNEACAVATLPLLTNDRIGVFHPSTGQWYLDINGNGAPDDCALGGCVLSFGQSEHLPVVGDWTGTGSTLLGVFDPNTRVWQLDQNGNDSWEGCAVDLCLGPFWIRSGLPVAGRWLAASTKDAIGLFFPKIRIWRLDGNGDGKRNLCRIDGCSSFGRLRGLPVAGDWTGTGTTKIGIFDPNTGLWKLDRNGNGRLDSCTVDLCLGPFGGAGDLPVAGDWNGTGQANIGVYDPTTGMWELDGNGNGLFENCDMDLCVGPFGQPGDLPIVGRW